MASKSILLFAVGVAVRLWFVRAWSTRYPWGDGLFYAVITEQVYRFGTLHDYLWLFPPGYSFSGLLIRPWVDTETALTVISLLSSALLPPVIYAVSRRFVPEREAFLAGVWTLLSPLLAGLSGEFLADALFILICWLMILITLRMTSIPSPKPGRGLKGLSEKLSVTSPIPETLYFSSLGQAKLACVLYGYFAKMFHGFRSGEVVLIWCSFWQPSPCPSPRLGGGDEKTWFWGKDEPMIVRRILRRGGLGRGLSAKSQKAPEISCPQSTNIIWRIKHGIRELFTWVGNRANGENGRKRLLDGSIDTPFTPLPVLGEGAGRHNLWIKLNEERGGVDKWCNFYWLVFAGLWAVAYLTKPEGFFFGLLLFILATYFTYKKIDRHALR